MKINHSLIRETFEKIKSLEQFKVDDYGYLYSDSWVPIEEAPVVFIQFFDLFQILNVKVDILNLEIIKYHCISSQESYGGDDYNRRISYSCKPYEVIQFLLEKNYLREDQCRSFINS
jgi:hypothetical protein